MLRLETLICTFSVLSVAARADFKARNCSEVREACVGKGFSFAHVPVQEIPGKAGLSQLGSRPAKQSIMTCPGSKHGAFLRITRSVFNVKLWVEKLEIPKYPIATHL